MNETYSLHIFKHILLALKHIHSLNIIHGDLNPTNIYINSKSKLYISYIYLSFPHSLHGNSSESKIDIVKIGDFSICLDELPCVLSDEVWSP